VALPADLPGGEPVELESVSQLWLIALSMAVETVPVLIAIRRWKELSRARRFVGVTFGVMVVQDVAMLLLALRHVNNLWVAHVGNPVQTALWLFAFAAWEERELHARALRYAAAGYVIVWIAVTLLLEDWTTFGQFTLPLQALLLVTVALYMMVYHVGQQTVAPWRLDVFWVSAGAVFYFGPTVLLGPVSRLLLDSRPDLVLLAFVLKAGVNLVAYTFVAIGLLCPHRSTSGGSSSLPPWSP
jgi:hypothetical protein